VASIAFGAAIPALDVNVRRVVARVTRGCDPQDLGSDDLEAAAGAFMDREDPGAWNQALMDLGRELCRPVPRCDACPLQSRCRFGAAGRPSGTLCAGSPLRGFDTPGAGPDRATCANGRADLAALAAAGASGHGSSRRRRPASRRHRPAPAADTGCTGEPAAAGAASVA
jgi:adenine-specific DNA glycosylase